MNSKPVDIISAMPNIMQLPCHSRRQKPPNSQKTNPSNRSPATNSTPLIIAEANAFNAIPHSSRTAVR
jgi:hypothetical protein